MKPTDQGGDAATCREFWMLREAVTFARTSSVAYDPAGSVDHHC